MQAQENTQVQNKNKPLYSSYILNAVLLFRDWKELKVKEENINPAMIKLTEMILFIETNTETKNVFDLLENEKDKSILKEIQEYVSKIKK